MKIALFPGSFDPVTKGHEDIIKRALLLFDKIYLAIGVNCSKEPLFPLETRKTWLLQCFGSESRIEICTYEGLTVDLCKNVNAQFIIRGIRNANDFQFEKDIAQANKQVAPGIETVFFATAPEFSHINSTIVRDIYSNHGDYKQFIPDKLK